MKNSQRDIVLHKKIKLDKQPSFIASSRSKKEQQFHFEQVDPFCPCKGCKAGKGLPKRIVKEGEVGACIYRQTAAEQTRFGALYIFL
jgi:hypothetical protein